MTRSPPSPCSWANVCLKEVLSIQTGQKEEKEEEEEEEAKKEKKKIIISKIPPSLADMALDSVIYDACRLIALAPHPKWPGLVGRSSVRRFTTSGYIVGEMEKGPALASFRNWGAWGSPQVHVGGTGVSPGLASQDLPLS